MSKSDIEKLDEQIQSILDSNGDLNESAKDSGRALFVDRLSDDNCDEESSTKRIEKIDDIVEDAHKKVDGNTSQFDIAGEDENNKILPVEDDHNNGLRILLLILIILILCIILILFL